MSERLENQKIIRISRKTKFYTLWRDRSDVDEVGGLISGSPSADPLAFTISQTQKFIGWIRCVHYLVRTKCLLHLALRTVHCCFSLLDT